MFFVAGDNKIRIPAYRGFYKRCIVFIRKMNGNWKRENFYALIA